MHRLTVSTKLVKHEKFFTLNVLSKHKSGKQFKLNASSWERSLQFWCCGALPTNWSPVSTLHELRTETQFQNWCTTTITHTYEANTHMIAIPPPGAVQKRTSITRMALPCSAVRIRHALTNIGLNIEFLHWDQRLNEWIFHFYYY